MGKRHDLVKEINKAACQIRPPIKLLLPPPNQYTTAGIDELIVLAIEGCDTLSTGNDIAKRIATITGGIHCYKQPYISKRIKHLNQNGFYARDKFLMIEKFEGQYKLVDTSKDDSTNLSHAINAIPFDRSSYFRNSPFNASIFGFKLIGKESSADVYVDDVWATFNKITQNHVFQVIAHQNTVYVLLDTSSKLYREALKRMDDFINKEFPTQ